MKVLVSDNLSALGVDKLRQEKDIEVEVKTGLSEDEIVKIIPEYDGMIVRSATKVTPKIIEAAEKLKVIGRAGVGVDNINLEAAGKHGIIVMNAPDGNLITTAEHSIALMLSMARNIPGASATLRGGKWSPKTFIGVELYNKTLGVIGLGRIGSAVVQRAKGFEMKVLGYDPYISKEHAEKLGVETSELGEILKRADFLTLHTPKVPGGPLLGKKEFKLMKPGMRIINCARGALIDTDALIEAIQNRIVAQAALDVYEKEPLDTESPLLKVDEIICTPHLGASTGEAQEKVALIIAEQLIDFLKNGSVKNAVNMPSIDAELLAQIKPYLGLAENLGKSIAQLHVGAIKSVHIQYNGEVSNNRVDPISVTLLQGLLSGTIDGVNMVNAPFLAKERNIQVQESISNEVQDYTSTIKVQVTTDKGTRTLVGSLSEKSTPRIVKIDDYNFEASFSKHMIIFENYDAPGVIGKVGNILGENNINIAGFHLGRLAEAGSKAVAVLNVDTAPTEKALGALKNTENLLEVYSVTL